ncbi:MAG TPA: hypothetical protein VMB78_00370 [Dissulfurispiraceae bacterium]|nr:hypothetical protein [Dissulfurispiraceae bacterium]
MAHPKRPNRLVSLFFFCLTILAANIGFEIAPAPAMDEPAMPLDSNSQLPEQKGTAYRTPRAGEGFTTVVFGREITVKPSDRRSVTALDLGVAFYKPLPEDNQFIPMGSLYLWHHPNDQSLLRADIALVYNDIFWAGSSPHLGPLEWVLTFNSFTLPVAQREFVDGRTIKSEELKWGYVRPGFGLGYRTKVAPGHQDNMYAVDLIIEPGFLYFAKGSKTAGNFAVPEDTFELRERLEVRFDAIERNLLSLPHRGFAAGGDLIHGDRTNWRNWGTNGLQLAREGRDYLAISGYMLAAGGVPGINSDRHRLICSLHGGAGDNLDRFSAQRIGGGVQTLGEEYGSTWRPVLPGAAIQEFFPKHYAIAAGEYRWEAFFFTYLSLDASLGWLDRMRQIGADIATKNDFFSSAGAHVTTGFFFDTRMQLAYNHNFTVIRRGRHGENEIVLHFSKDI